MIQILIISAFVCARLRDSLHGSPSYPHGWMWALLPAALSVLLVFASSRAVLRAMDSRGSPHLAGRAHNLALVTQVLSGLCLCFALLLTDWPRATLRQAAPLPVLADLFALCPLLLMVLAHWSSLYPIERRLREAILLRQLDTGAPIYPPLTRAQYLWNRARFEILLVLVPILLASLWHEGLDLAPRLLGSPDSPLWTDLFAALSWLGLPLVLILGPALLRHIWDLVPIGPGPLRDAADAMCRQYRIRVRGPFLWRTHGTIVNAAILGLVRPFRYLLFTDAMLDRMPEEQVEAVMAHEVAHVREHHLIWMFAALAASILALPLLLEPLLPADPGRFGEVGVEVLILALVGLVFGLVSRRFEWQADAFSVKHLSRRLAPESPVVVADAARLVAATLLNVADLNGVPPDKFSFRHGSIASRCRKAMSLAGRPLDTLPPDRAARVIKIISVVILTLALALTLLGTLQESHV